MTPLQPSKRLWADDRMQLVTSAHGKKVPSRRAVAIVVTYVLAGVTAVFSYKLGLGSFREPGPGLWPMLISLGLLVTATASLFAPEPDEEVMLDDDDQEYATADGDGEAVVARSRGVIDLAVAVSSLLVFVVAFNWLGMVLPTFALLLLWLRFLGRESWLQATVVALSITAGIWLIFVRVLALPLPTDILGI